MPITQSFLNKTSAVSFTSAAAIDTFFTRQNVHDFVSWFNTFVANKSFWGRSGSRAGVSMANDSKAHERFDQLWSPEGIKAMFGRNSVSLLQFLSLQSIINNETGGSLLPLTERVGRTGHPGIAYAFDRIPGIKKSYNTLAGNKTCFQLFNDVNYNKAFQNFALGTQLRNTTNNVWASEAYPQNLAIATSTNPAVTGYVLEADFFKFRGRGFIQTTGRANYVKLVEFVMKYQGTNSVVNATKAKWAQRSTDSDVLATISSNAEWDDLFQNSNTLIPAKSIEIHNGSAGNYLGNINGTKPALATSTIRNVGKRISGADSYANLFINRVTQIIELL
ncbi:MAG: hypothetical protein ABIR18_04830 [Chitinophagaceae bacterium]